MLVADAGPIIALVRIKHLGILQRAAGEVLIPDAVYRELVIEGRGRAGTDEIRRADWIKRRSLGKPLGLDTQRSGLHAGELEAIALAKELRLFC